jgi:hypothetical protein
MDEETIQDRQDEARADGDFSAIEQVEVAREAEAQVADELHTYNVGDTVTIRSGPYAGAARVLAVRDNVFPTPMYSVQVANGDTLWVLYEEVAPAPATAPAAPAAPQA